MDFRSAIYRYCDYQDRCQYEVRSKLLEIGCRGEELEELIAELIEKNLLNEERYAQSIARGKFRMKQWGKIKIVHFLKNHRISEYCIKTALKEIDEGEYEITLNSLIDKKWISLKGEKNRFIKQKKLLNYMQQKGFETTLVMESLQNLLTSK